MTTRSAILFLLFSAVAAVAQSGCVAGQVFDDSGSPLAKMHVTVASTNHPFYRLTDTDENGRFLLADLPLGSYRIFTRNEDLGYTFSNNADFSGTSEELHVVVPDSAECTQTTMRREPRAGKLRLKLTDLSTGREIQKPEASFRRIDGPHAWDAVTLYQNDLLVPPSKPLEVQLGAIGYEKTDLTPVAPLQPGEVRVLSAQLRPIGVGCFTGIVLAEDGTPVGGIKVQPLLQSDYLNAKEPLFVVTDKQGKFIISNLHPGTYEVFVDGQDKGYSGFSTMRTYGQFPQINVLASPTCAELTVGLAPPGARLHVEVVDAITQEPIKYFKFTVKSTVPKRWWYSESITEEILVPPDKPCSLEVRSDGYKSSSPESLGSLQPGEVRRVKVLLHPDTEQH